LMYIATVLLSVVAVRAQKDTRCYSCTTMNAEQLLMDVQTDRALRSGVRSQVCDNGVCMKMWFQQKDGNAIIIQARQMCGGVAFLKHERKFDRIAREYPVPKVTWKCASATVISATLHLFNYRLPPPSYSPCHGFSSRSS
ncbi:hypothetical protein PFISCL1PPCAC_27975, partial [Pristionchus fissidentatus]